MPPCCTQTILASATLHKNRQPLAIRCATNVCLTWPTALVGLWIDRQPRSYTRPRAAPQACRSLVLPLRPRASLEIPGASLHTHLGQTCLDGAAQPTPGQSCHFRRGVLRFGEARRNKATGVGTAVRHFHYGTVPWPRRHRPNGATPHGTPHPAYIHCCTHTHRPFADIFFVPTRNTTVAARFKRFEPDKNTRRCTNMRV